MSILQWNIKIDEHDWCVIMYALNEHRNELIRKELDTKSVDELFVRIHDTAPKKANKERHYEAR